MKNEKKSMSAFIRTSLSVLFYALIVLVILSIFFNSFLLIFPDTYQYELRVADNKIEEPDIKITIENWKGLPDYLKIFIILRKNLSGIIYLIVGLIIVFMLRKLYKKVLVKENFSILNAIYINKIGLTLIIYSIVDFLSNLLLNVGITYNNYTSTTENIHVGTRVIPSFAFEIFIFGFIILVISDIYLRLNEIQNDLKLTI